MKTFILQLTACTLISASLFITSCKKETNDSANNENAIRLSSSHAEAENMYEDVYDVAMDAADDAGIYARTTQEAQEAYRITLPACATVTVTPATQNVFPKTVVVDFGTGCTNSAGIIRKGKITFIFSAKLKTAGATVSAAFDNYMVNNYKLEGSYSILNSSIGNGVSFTTQISNGRFTYPDGKVYNFSGNKTVTQTAGQSTANMSDDEFTITGFSNYSSSAGEQLTASITSPLIKKFSCKWIVGGITRCTYNALNAELNYGNGTCDNKAVLTMMGQTREVLLPR
jgi:hypothetical protein